MVDDHPGADYEFDVGKASSFGIPADWGGDQDLVVCTITFPSSSAKVPVVAWKECTDAKGRPITGSDRTPAAWNVLTTKALGRACKRAGYPDNMDELKALMAWRRRGAEVLALVGGTAPVAELTGGDADRALDAAAVADPDHVGADDEPDTEPADDVAEGDVMASDEDIAAMRAALGSLGKLQSNVLDWVKSEGLNLSALTEHELVDVMAVIAEWAGGTDDA